MFFNLFNLFNMFNVLMNMYINFDSQCLPILFFLKLYFVYTINLNYFMKWSYDILMFWY